MPSFVRASKSKLLDKPRTGCDALTEKIRTWNDARSALKQDKIVGNT